MSIAFFTTVKKQTQRHYVRVMAFVVCCLIVVGTIVYFIAPKQEVLAPVVSSNTQVSTIKPQYARSAPKYITIPKINLSTSFVPPLGLNPDKTVSVPDSFTQVGWYSGGATPGEIGPAVVLGHVDSYQGPAVFYSLGQLKQADEIYITREDGSSAVFVVEKLMRYSQDNFPTADVYGPIEYAGLRLVTCTGIYDRTKKKYTQNLVVYARLKKDE